MRLKLHYLLISTALTGFAMPAIAQDAPAPAGQPGDVATAKVANDKTKEKKPAAGQTDAVVVTGTRIQRPNVVSAAPITSVTSQEIKAQSPVTIEEVLNRLPQVAPDAQQNYQDSDGRQRIKLRNLGFERTLVLIDGKRLGTVAGRASGRSHRRRIVGLRFRRGRRRSQLHPEEEFHRDSARRKLQLLQSQQQSERRHADGGSRRLRFPDPTRNDD
jgi:outer membrane receptor protein involved in Fe transport